MNPSARFGRMILAICEAVVGVVLLVNPIGFTTGIITFLGVLLLLFGVISVVQYFRAPPETAALEQKLARGLVMALIGLFCMFNSGWFITAFPLLTVIYGSVTLLTGVVKIQWTVDMVRMKAKKWFWVGLDAALTIVCAVIILCNPFSSAAVLWMFVAVTLIAEAILDLIAAIFSKKAAE